MPLFTESLTAARRAEDKYLEAVCLHNLGDAAMQTGRLERAEECLADSLALFELLGHRPLAARTALLQGEVAVLRGDTASAHARQRGALAELKEIGDTQGIATALEAIACAQSTRQPRLALVLYGAAAGLRVKNQAPSGAGPPTGDRTMHEARANGGGRRGGRGWPQPKEPR